MRKSALNLTLAFMAKTTPSSKTRCLIWIPLFVALIMAIPTTSSAQTGFSGDELEIRVYGIKLRSGWVLDDGRSYLNFDGSDPGPGIVPDFVPMTIDEHVAGTDFEIDHQFQIGAPSYFILDFVPDATDPNKGILNIRLKDEWANFIYNSNGHRLLLEVKGFDLGSPAIFGDIYDPFNNFRTINDAAFPPTSPDDGFTLIMGRGNYGSPHASALQAGGTYDAVSNPYPIIFSMEISGGTVPEPNEAPTAVAGDAQSIRAGDSVLLDGSASFDDNTAPAALDYAWSFFSTPGGSVAALDFANTAFPEFVADVAGTYTLELIVTDEGGLLSIPAYVEISSDNLAPTAVATANFSLAIVGQAIQFDGSGSTDAENDALTYEWGILSAPATSTAVLIGADTAMPTLTPDVEGVYEVVLLVSDFLGYGTPGYVEVTATTATGFAESQIVDVCDVVDTLTAGQVTTAGNQNAFGGHLANAVKDIQKGNVEHAIETLNKAIARTDGCVLRGSPDGNGQGMDWILDCGAQEFVYDLLNSAVVALEL